MVLRALSLCAGIGGLDYGLKLALGDGVRTVCYVEREAYAAAVLVARMEESALDTAPIWDDLDTFNARAWRGVVDIVVAGFPCQPWSVAGSRRGAADERWLWPRIEAIIGDVGPRYAFLENVPGLVSGGGLGPVLGGLADLGYDAEWTTLRASDVGAPHRRERAFILAFPHGYVRPGSRRTGLAGSTPAETGSAESRMGRGERGTLPALPTSCVVVDAEGQLWGSSRNENGSSPYTASDRTLGDPDLPRSQRRERPHGERPDELPTWPPGPEEWDRWEYILEWWPHLAPATEPGVRRVADGSASRVDRLRALGNAVVPLQAAVAFRTLVERVVLGE